MSDVRYDNFYVLLPRSWISENVSQAWNVVFGHVVNFFFLRSISLKIVLAHPASFSPFKKTQKTPKKY